MRPFTLTVDLSPYGPNCDDDIDYQEYLDYLANVIYQAQKLGRDGMRICINCALIVNSNSKKGGDFKNSVIADLIYKVHELNRKYDDCCLRFWGHFNWYKQNNGGRVCQGSIILPSGDPVPLVLTSADLIHLLRLDDQGPRNAEATLKAPRLSIEDEKDLARKSHKGGW